MKKNLMVACFALTLAAGANAQKIDASKLPAPVSAAFAKAHPGVTAKWEKEGTGYEAGFKEKNISVSVVYEANGTLVETEKSMNVSDLPAAALKYVSEHYNNAKIKEAAVITKANGTVNYEAEVSGKDVMFDGQGNFIKESKD